MGSLSATSMPQQEMSAARWILLRALPALVAVALVAAGAGIFRSVVVFVVGLQGMLLGGILGYFSGRIGRGDPGNQWGFGQRILFSLTAGFLYAFISFFIVALFNADGSIMEWLADVVSGSASEHAVSSGRYGARMDSMLSGAWWAVFVILDAGLFSFLFLAGNIMGLSPAEKDDNEDEYEDDGERPQSDALEAEDDDSPDFSQGTTMLPGCMLLVAVLLGAALCVAAVEAVAWVRDKPQSFEEQLETLEACQGMWEIVSGDDCPDLPRDTRFTIAKAGENLYEGRGSSGSEVRLRFMTQFDGVKGLMEGSGETRYLIDVETTNAPNELGFRLWTDADGGRTYTLSAVRIAS